MNGMTMRRTWTILAGLGVWLGAGGGAGLFGHHFWLELSSYRPAPGEAVEVGIRLGDTWPGETFARYPSHFQRFELLSQGRSYPIPGRSYREPAGLFRAPVSIDSVVVYQSHWSMVSLSPEKFLAYAEEEGAPLNAEQRAALERRDRPVRERFARCAKAVIADNHQAPGSRIDELEDAGMPLELVWLGLGQQGFEDSLGEAWVRLLDDGRPLKNACVKVFHESLAQPWMVRTDEEGSAKVDVAHGGVWMFAAVHLQPASEASGADWESLWASLTVDIGGK